MNLHRRFTRISVEGEGVPAIVEALSEVTGRPAVFEDDQFVVQSASADFGTLGLELPLPRDQAFQNWARSLETMPTDAPIQQFTLPEANLTRLVAPVFVRKRPVGYLTLLDKSSNLDETLFYALSGAASACAMEMARKLAVVEVENRFRGEFLDSLLEGGFHSADELTSRAKTVGYDPARSYVVAVTRFDPTKTHRPASSFSEAESAKRLDEYAAFIQDELAASTPGLLLRVKDDTITILVPVQDSDANLAAVEETLERVRASAAQSLTLPASVGIGRYHATYRGIANSYKEAREALAVAQNLLGGQRSAFFGNLGIYRLLLLLKDAPELKDFYEETLGPIISYDKKNHTDLIDTLAAYFACHGNVENTAQALYLHRNTLAYRLRRVEQLTNLDLKNLEDSFRLQLALKARTVIPKTAGRD
jgi:purine catabolism regulator